MGETPMPLYADPEISVPGRENCAKQSQTWASWGIWGIVRHAVFCAKQSQFEVDKMSAKTLIIRCLWPFRRPSRPRKTKPIRGWARGGRRLVLYKQTNLAAWHGHPPPARGGLWPWIRIMGGTPMLLPIGRSAFPGGQIVRNKANLPPGTQRPAGSVAPNKANLRKFEVCSLKCEVKNKANYRPAERLEWPIVRNKPNLSGGAGRASARSLVQTNPI